MTNPQSGSFSTCSSTEDGDHNNKKTPPLPALFVLLEQGKWSRAATRARRHPKEVKAWFKLPKKKNGPIIKCKALHHACYKLRNVHAQIKHDLTVVQRAFPGCHDDNGFEEEDDLWIEACQAIQTLIDIHPEACSQRESHHGCLPIHLAVFSMCP
eukprot:CAMPEP_0197830472 /NCGR_PEP_ID=MMETSP1437-20131217/7086_1 /TAXON_ID=49252 ORGANISM="Eucampia antarctica, Strain CCMP1452" /NCGR_SAMPLE_ID=MMETSP1437 /ASSEMBLY_ACC=CAM_ASM_001096 /LENGTH=154 /DNA_ID=CAMNT_0043432901 /DNA_START=29 /DNA_END=489 /DNA_ORIENTATION=-